MVITATSEEHARKIFKKLEKEGFEYKMTYCYIQEWRRGDEVVLVGKGYNDKKVHHGYLY